MLLGYVAVLKHHHQVSAIDNRIMLSVLSRCFYWLVSCKLYYGNL